LKTIRRLILSAIVIVAGSLSFVATTPMTAHANSNDEGSVTFAGELVLPAYPCLAPGCAGPVAVCLTAAAGVVVHGTTATAVAKLCVTVTNYTEPCAPVTGTATGFADAYDASGNLLSREYFNWVRVGLSATLVLGANANPGVPGVLGQTQPNGAGAAAFALVGVPSVCNPLAPANGGPLTVLVTGSGSW
jgi:hypothetical protein